MNKKLLGIGILLVLLSAGTAMAFRGDFGLMQDTETREQIQTAIENNDFTAWKQLHESMLTEENFNSVRERMQERNQFMEERQQNMEDIQAAIENQDYEAWLALHEENSMQMGKGIFSAITEDNFYLLKELQDARQAGDTEAVKEIMEELGLEPQQFNERNRMKKGVGMKGNCPFSNPSTE